MDQTIGLAAKPLSALELIVVLLHEFRELSMVSLLIQHMGHHLDLVAKMKHLDWSDSRQGEQIKFAATKMEYGISEICVAKDLSVRTLEDPLTEIRYLIHTNKARKSHSLVIRRVTFPSTRLR
jgi:hypothetical protein